MAATNTNCSSPPIRIAASRNRLPALPVTRIGEITRGKQMKLATTNGKTEILKPAGWEHFA